MFEYNDNEYKSAAIIPDGTIFSSMFWSNKYWQ